MVIQRQVSFGEAIKRAIVENYCNFQGRASRSEYWWYCLFTFLLGLCVTFIFGNDTAGQVISGIVSLALLLPGLGLVWRRLHDIGKAGGYYFFVLIPLVGWIILIVWLCKPSEPQANRFGPEPNMVNFD